MFAKATPRRGTVAAAILGLAAASLAIAPPAQSNVAGTGLVISEVFIAGGSGGAVYSADYVELYNPTASAVSVDGLSVQYKSATGAAATSKAELAGSVAPGGYYLVKGTGAASTGLTPDATGGFAASGSSGLLVLANGTSLLTIGAGSTAADSRIVDAIGYGSANAYEGVAKSGVGTVSDSLSRATSGVDTDNNNADFTVGSPTLTSSGPAALSATNPGDRTATTGQVMTPFTLQASGGTTPYAWTATGLPSGVTVAANGDVSGTPTAPGVSNVTATVTDSAAPSPRTAQTAFRLTVSDAQVATIAEIQGNNTNTSPLVSTTVTTAGVVTASFPVGGIKGFNIQTGGSPATPNASDGLFVFAGANLTEAQYPAVGATVEVTGAVSEFFGQTQITLAGAGAVVSAATAQDPVVPSSVVPGTDCALPGDSCLSGGALDAAREVQESEIFLPTGDYTVTDSYDGSPAPSTSSSFFGELGLAAESDRALVQPTELFDSQTEMAEIANREAYNDAHRMILNDGSTTNYSTATDQPFPWFTADHYVRAGADVSFDQPVVLTWNFGNWKLEPSGGQVVGKPTGQVTFEQNRPLAPEDVGGDIRLATFNVLNYFPTTGEEYEAAPLNGSCSYFTDREGNNITNRSCSDNGPRGAADGPNLARQQAKIVNAINGLDASIVSLEEIENSAKFNKDRDFAVNTLVDALNAASSPGTWAAAQSPSAVNLPPLAQEDVIRTAFIYKPAQVALVGESQALSGMSDDGQPFSNAREPLAQGFKGAGQSDTEAFTVVVNHLKSKSTRDATGDNADTGQGGYNGDRTRQAAELKTFASDFSAQLGGNGAVFLTGDFNAYSSEDPVQKIEENGDYNQLESSSDPLEESYNFGGLDGSLDHVFANPVAEAMVTGVDIWNINADESVYQEYSRYNYNVTDLYNTTPFRASDHNPEIVGIDLADIVEPLASTTKAKASPGKVEVFTSSSVLVKVKAKGETPTGTVELRDGNALLASGTLSDGEVSLPTGRLQEIGKHTFEVRYLGDDAVAPSSDTVTVKVVKQSPDLILQAPDKVTKGSSAEVVVMVEGVNAEVTGTVVFKVAGDEMVRNLTNGRAAVSFDDLEKNTTVKVSYLGDSEYFEKAVATITIKVGKS